MRFKFVIIHSVLLFQVAAAQNSPAPLSLAQETNTTSVSSVPSTIAPADPTSSTTMPMSGETLIMDYKSVYEAATLEEEVKMATERFKLTPTQEDVWLKAATDRRQIEKQVYDQLNSKGMEYNRDAQYRTLRTSHNTFYETIIGYFSPAQKQALELDRAILQEKQKRLAKLPPPPAPVVTITVAPVDSTTIKKPEKIKATDKKTKRKKKVGA